VQLLPEFSKLVGDLAGLSTLRSQPTPRRWTEAVFHVVDRQADQEVLAVGGMLHEHLEEAAEPQDPRLDFLGAWHRQTVVHGRGLAERPDLVNREDVRTAAKRRMDATDDRLHVGFGDCRARPPTYLQDDRGQGRIVLAALAHDFRDHLLDRLVHPRVDPDGDVGGGFLDEELRHGNRRGVVREAPIPPVFVLLRVSSEHVDSPALTGRGVRMVPRLIFGVWPEEVDKRQAKGPLRMGRVNVGARRMDVGELSVEIDQERPRVEGLGRDQPKLLR
jgi:hypothetical protein